MAKNMPANAGDTGDTSSATGLGRFPGERNGNPLHYSCLEYLMDRGAWRVMVSGVTKSWTQLSTFAYTVYLLSIYFLSSPEIKVPIGQGFLCVVLAVLA